MNVALLVVFGLAFVVFVYFAIACEVAYSLACRERTDRDRWVATSQAEQDEGGTR